MISLNKIIFQSLINQSTINKSTIRYGYYIHLKDHNKKINPQKSKLHLSYMNPKIIKQGTIKEQSYLFSLRRKTQKELERKMFEEYKEKVLKGQIDQDEELVIDPLWGEGEKPKHYYQTLSKSEIMKVDHSQNSEFIQNINNLYADYFKVEDGLIQLPTFQELKNMSPSQLVNVALFARSTQIEGIGFWFHLENSFGNKFYELNIDELIKLTYSLKGLNKKGTPRVHQILNDLLSEQLHNNNFNRQQLIVLFYSLQHSKTQGVELQDKILDKLIQFYPQMNTEQKINWFLTYAFCRKPQNYKKRQEKSLFESQAKAHKVLFNLDLYSNDLTKDLTVQSCVNLIYALAKTRVNNTKFITDDILTFLKVNVEKLTSNLDLAYKVLFYFQQVQGGCGIYDEEFFNNLISTLTESNNFASLSKYHQIKTIYAIWNYNLLTDDLFELYKNIAIQADSTLLHYFNQIQLSRSSERQWQILQCTAQLPSIPLPYYQSFQRFCTYMKATTEWDLTPIEDKLKNIEYYFDSKRCTDGFYQIGMYKSFRKYLEFSGQICPFQHSVPINNLEIVQFAFSKLQVTVDIVNQSAFVQNTDRLKESYRSKIRSLANMGWKHVVMREKLFSLLAANQQILQIVCAYQPYEQEQLQIIQNKDYYRAEVIESLRNQEYWDSMIAEEAEGYRNDPEGYAKKIAQIAEKERKLSEQLAKIQ